MSEHTDSVYSAVNALRGAEAEQMRIDRALRDSATQLAMLLLTRLHHVDGTVLRRIKDELQGFNATRRKWRGER